MEDTDLQWNFIKNSTEYYEWEFIHSEKVSNIEVEGIEKDENGHYKATKDGKIKYTWDYTNGNKSIKYVRSKNISRLDYISDGKLVHASGYMNTSDFKEASFGFDFFTPLFQ